MTTTLDPSITRMLTKTLISSDFADSGDNTFAETQALLALAGVDILQEVHLARFKDIALTIKFSEVASANGGAATFTNMNLATQDDVISQFNTALLAAAANKIYKTGTTVTSTGFTSLNLANAKTGSYLAQAVSPGVGPSWYKSLLKFQVGNLQFKIKITPGTNAGTFTIAEVTSADTDYNDVLFVKFPSNPIIDDFTAAVAIRTNNTTSIMKPSDLPPGTFKSKAAVVLVTGKQASTSEDLSSISQGTTVLSIISLITSIPSGNLLSELIFLPSSSTNGTPNGILKKAIGDAAASDKRLAEGIFMLTYNDSYSYASDDTPLATRPIDFISSDVYQYSAKVTKIIDWLRTINRGSDILDKIYLNNDSNSTQIKADLLSTAQLDIRANGFTNSSVTTTNNQTKDYINVFRAVTDALLTEPLNLTKLLKVEDLANYLSSSGTGVNVTSAPAATTSLTNGINADEGKFNTLLTAIVNDPNPSISHDQIFDALVLMANQSNINRSTIEDVNKIISTWFTPNVTSQFPSMTPATNAIDFWGIPATGVYTEEHAKRLMANYIAINYNLRLLKDQRNNKYFDLLIKTGTKTDNSISPLQRTDLYSYNNSSSIIVGNVPSETKIGTALEIFALLNPRNDISTYTKIRFYNEQKNGAANEMSDIIDLIAVFGEEVIYRLTEIPLKKDGTEAIVVSSQFDENSCFSFSTNLPTGTSYLPTYLFNNDEHKILVKRIKYIGRLIDVYNKSTNSSLRANKIFELAKRIPDFNKFVRYGTNFNTRNQGIFKNIITNWLQNELTQSISPIVVSSDTYYIIVKDAIMTYLQGAASDGNLNLDDRLLSSAVDTLSTNNTALLTPTISYALIYLAELAVLLKNKDKNVDKETVIDRPFKLIDFIGTNSKQDQILAGLIASSTDNSKDIFKLNDSGRAALVDIGMPNSDINSLVISKSLRITPWKLSKEIEFQYLAGQNEEGKFVADVF